MKFNVSLILDISPSSISIVRDEIPMFIQVPLYRIIPHNIVYYYVTCSTILIVSLQSFNISYHSFIQNHFHHVHTLKHKQSSFDITWFHVDTSLVMLLYIRNISTKHLFMWHSSQESFWYHQYISYHSYVYSFICSSFLCQLSMLPLLLICASIIFIIRHCVSCPYVVSDIIQQLSYVFVKVSAILIWILEVHYELMSCVSVFVRINLFLCNRWQYNTCLHNTIFISLFWIHAHFTTLVCILFIIRFCFSCNNLRKDTLLNITNNIVCNWKTRFRYFPL